MRTVLVADDDPQSRELLQTLLSAQGYEVRAAANGAEALEQARLEPPDLIVTDILMPVMDGFELCRAWRAEPALCEVPFVFYTATYTDARDEQFAFSLGADRFLVKPQEPQVLLPLLQEVLETGRSGGGEGPDGAAPEEAVYFRQYNEALIRKLEQKMKQVEEEVRARRQTEAVLRESEEKYRRLFETMLQGVVYQDREGRLTDANPAAERILGISLAEARGQHAPEIEWETLDEEGHPLALDERPSMRALRDGQPVEDVVLQVGRRGRSGARWIKVSSIPLFRAAGATPYAVYTTIDDITERRRTEEERSFANGVIDSLSVSGDTLTAVRQILLVIREYAGVEAVGLRLVQAHDFPYYETSGLPEDFVKLENSLCRRVDDGGFRLDAAGKPVLECMCGAVISGRINRSRPCFTEGGSFWTNNAAGLAAQLPPEEQPQDARNRCLQYGYQSLALIPLRSGAETVGLLQLSDRRPDRLSLRLVSLLENLGTTIGIAVARQRAEEALRQSEELFRRIVQDQTEMICRSLPDGTITFVNDAYSRFLGLSQAELVGRRLREVLPPAVLARIEEAVAALTPEQPVATLELSSPSADGRTGWMQWTHRAFFDDSGALVAAQATGSDITALKMAEEQHRLAAVGQLAAGVAHDFNNLLQAMGLNAQMVDLGRVTPQKLVQIVLNSTRRGSEITRNLMAFARPDEPQREAARLEASLDAALAVAARQLADAEIRVVRQYPAAATPVVFDRAQMEQVFLNLIINASHAMPDGGTLTISTDYRHDAALIEIGDTGTGIAPEHLPRIFEPFFTTKGRLGESETAGSGLGLSVTHGFVAAHGGTISVTSTLGAGSRFEIRLPRGEQPLRPPAADANLGPAAADLARLRGRRILLAEDEGDVLTVLRHVLTAAECKLTAVRSAEEAIAALERQHFDLVLSDLMMPGGGGRAVVQFVRGRGEEGPPVIVMSGRLERALHDEVLALGAARTLEKPFDATALTAVLAELLR